MAGIADVARAAGVSKSTASRALTGAGYVSDETRTKVQDAAAALGAARKGQSRDGGEPERDVAVSTT